MKIKNIIRSLALFITLSVSLDAVAMSSSFTTYESKLAFGKWAKVRVHETGVYEITAEQLAELGFNDINAVKVFGQGGYVLSEVLNNSQPNDLSQVPTLTTDDKIIFYALGPVQVTANSVTTKPYHTITVNPYSQYGYYFITDSDRYQPLAVAQATSNVGTTVVDSSYDYLIHNRDLFSFLNSGKTFYGEDMFDIKEFEFELPNHVNESDAVAYFAIGATTSTTNTVKATINEAPLVLSTSTLKKLTSNKEFEVNTTSASASGLLAADKYKLSFDIDKTGLEKIRLDYFTITYQRQNAFPKDSTQIRMSFAYPSKNNRVVIDGAQDDVVVWDVTNNIPYNQHTFSGDDTEMSFAQSCNANWETYVAFKPAEKLKQVHIEGFVENQNLHGASTPHMVIIYPKNFKLQAEKIAEIHNSFDNLDVLIIEESLIFNEFSSGAKDATAYRLFMKMLYDRNPQKLKYLLLLGCGSYDNRQLKGPKSENQLLTYQSADSNGIISSFVTDDYFGFLADNSGKSIPTDVLSISVGRIPAKTVEDAEATINKTLNYIIGYEIDNWRHNAVIMSDKGDEDLHTTQAEALEILLNETLGGDVLNLDKIYQEWYKIANISENIETGTENWARLRFEELLKEGLLYTSYIGHAGDITLTYYNRLWSVPDIQSTKYTHLPFITLAACETAEFDHDERSFSEELILTPNGGAIGVLSAARTVYSSQNDKLNRAVTEYLFSLKENGEYRTIGEACMEAKKTFGTTYNYNKLSFTLFGDPAVKFRFPINRAKVNQINDQSPADGFVTVNPASAITVSGIITDAEGNQDYTFNGTITVMVYDKEIPYKDLTSPNTKVVYNCKYPREKLAHSNAIVENGAYTASIALPANCLANNENGLIRIFAKANDGRIVSGCESNITIAAYTEESAMVDTKAPEITLITIDGQEVGHKVNASANPIIYFEAVDDLAINTKPNDISGSMSMVVDGGKYTVSSLSNYTSVANDGKTLSGSVNLNNLSIGKHTVKIEIYDIAGNVVSQEVSFHVVEEFVDCQLYLNGDVVRDCAEVLLISSRNVSDINIIISDTQNNVVFTKPLVSSNYVWDLYDNNGNRVKPGKYIVSATFRTDNTYGHTGQQAFIVLGE